MRIDKRLSLTVCVATALLLPALLLLLPVSGSVALAQTGAAPDGKAVFLAQKCLRRSPPSRSPPAPNVTPMPRC